MPKTSYTAIDPNGVIHKRTTESRKYSHTVVALRSKDWALKAAVSKEMNRHHVSNFSHYSEFLNGTSRFLERRSWQTKEQHQEAMENDIQRARDALQGDMTVEDYIARKQREDLEAVEKADQCGAFTSYSNLGWCGRLDLAQKLASKENGGYWIKTVILEAVKTV
jgi:ribosomal protein S18